MRALQVTLSGVLVLAGCNDLLGLDTTRAAKSTADFDGDGVANVDDNCPTVANPDQADRDRDQLGDACDPCPLGPESGIDADRDGIDDACDPCPRGVNHDDDGDGLFDACDNCPADPNPDQANADGDDLGDACDPDSTAVQHRGYFDGFGSLSDAWVGLFPWQEVADAVQPDPLPTTPPPFATLWRPDDSYDDLDTVEVRLDPTGAPLQTVVGFNIVDVTESEQATCALLNDQIDGWELLASNFIRMPIAPPTAPVLLRLHLTPTDQSCELVGGATIAQPFGYTGMHSVQLTSNAVQPFFYVDVIRR